MEELDYYTRNKEARKLYQRRYYQLNRARISRKRMLEEIDNPKKFKDRKNYNKSYYEKNKEKILKRRKEQYLARKTLVAQT
jgi:peptide methionine sulfoxide reductase MsrA|tara:strand:+ start:152 stop:394 length:243 start_codon:yes stop_codon:yes gene_type:complete